MNTELVRFIDSISRDKNIDKESVFADLEAAMVSAARKAYDDPEDVIVLIDRVTGDITATVDKEPIDMKTLGRIAAQTAKQVMIQKFREDERIAIFDEYSKLVGTVATGTLTRYEGGGLVVNLGRAEAFLPRSEQIPGDQHHPGERVRAMILNVREEHNQVRIILTQTHPDYIRKLFELEVPEVGERVIEIRALAREAGYRTKVAVSSIDMKVDAVGACVGVRGSRIRNIVDELGGEKIDIVRWNESSQVLISNSLKPAEVRETFLCFELGRASVIVEEDQLSLAIGKRGQNVRLASQLTGWDIDIQSPAAYDKNVDDMEKALHKIEGIEDVSLDKMLAMGIVSLAELAEVGADPLVNDLGLNAELAEHVIGVAVSEAKRIAAEQVVAKAEARQAAMAEQATANDELSTVKDEQTAAKDEPADTNTDTDTDTKATDTDTKATDAEDEAADSGTDLDSAAIVGSQADSDSVAGDESLAGADESASQEEAGESSGSVDESGDSEDAVASDEVVSSVENQDDADQAKAEAATDNS